jgi:hypothetical protein
LVGLIEFAAQYPDPHIQRQLRKDLRQVAESTAIIIKLAAKNPIADRLRTVEATKGRSELTPIIDSIIADEAKWELKKHPTRSASLDRWPHLRSCQRTNSRRSRQRASEERKSKRVRHPGHSGAVKEAQKAWAYPQSLNLRSEIQRYLRHRLPRGAPRLPRGARKR